MTAKSTLTGKTLSIDFGDFGGSGSFGGIQFRSLTTNHEPATLRVGCFELISIFGDEDESDRAYETSNALQPCKAA